MLKTKVLGCEFSNPIGVAAGFDKNAELVRFISDLGFGFIEVGSVTSRANPGNSKPRLFRLPEDHALINRMGLNNVGADAVIGNLNKHSAQARIIVGINIAKTHDPTLLGADAITDIVQCYETVAQKTTFIVINISCPNTKEGKTFEEIGALTELLKAIQTTRTNLNSKTPILIKFSSDISLKQLEAAITTCEEFSVDGYVISNTSTSRQELSTCTNVIDKIGHGGLSGNPIFTRSLKRVQFVHRLLSGNTTIIGVGGIDSATCAYEYIRAGASLVELYTGMIYSGPYICSSIKQGLIELLKKDGFEHISEAVGTLNK